MFNKTLISKESSDSSAQAWKGTASQASNVAHGLPEFDYNDCMTIMYRPTVRAVDLCSAYCEIKNSFSLKH